VAAEDVELIRRGYAAWNSGDIDAVVDSLDHEVEWHGHPQLPEPGPFVGRDAVRRWFEIVSDAWESISVRPLAFAEAGDDVVVLIHIAGRGRGSGVEVASGVDAHIWTVVGGSVTRLRWLQGNEAAKRVALSDLATEVLRLRVELDLPDSAIAQRLGLAETQVAEAAEEALAKMTLLAEGGDE
jgi:uncharacterized protein